MNRYKLIIAENYLCVPACLEMVMKSEGYDTVNQFDIGNYFGVVLPPNTTISGIHNYVWSENSAKHGIILENNSINLFFKYIGANLSEQFIGIRTIDRDFFSDQIANLLNTGSHLICGYDYYTLFETEENGQYSGHVSIVVAADTHNDLVEIIDPGPKEPGIRLVSAYDLYTAVSKAKDGLWVISREMKNHAMCV